MNLQLQGRQEFENTLRAIGARFYHDKHPFHLLLHGGRLNLGQVQAWALNRFEYQRCIPIKDAIILSRMDDPSLRRLWRQRILDHDGRGQEDGGIARWLHLTDALGLDRTLVTSGQALLPGTRFAVQAYLQFVREHSLLEAIASSLTELFSPTIIEYRIASMLTHYDFISTAALAYFEHRLHEAPRDSDFALNYVKEHARTREDQHRVSAALRFKCSLLWAQLDALYLAYVAEPNTMWPDAFQPGAVTNPAVEHVDIT